MKPKNWKDLLDDTPFTRKDIIHLQDPLNLQVRHPLARALWRLFLCPLHGTGFLCSSYVKCAYAQGDHLKYSAMTHVQARMKSP